MLLVDHTDQLWTWPSFMRKFSALLLSASFLFAGLMVKRVDPAGDHVTLYVIAPVPSLQFKFGDGGSQWRRGNPLEPEPWWISGDDLVIFEN